MSGAQRIFDRRNLDRGARRRYLRMVSAANRGDSNAQVWLKAKHDADAKRKAGSRAHHA